MFQSFSETSSPEQGPPRLAALRAEMAAAGLDGFIVPRADAHQGEYVAERDSRLAWLTGFTGSAGFCVALQDKAGVFIDGRYRVQVRAQVADVFTPVHWPEVTLGDWVSEHVAQNGIVGFDPWLHTVSQIRELEASTSGVTLQRTDNLVDRIWADQPAPPATHAFAQPVDLAGEAHGDKIARLAATLGSAHCAVLTLPDSICWLLNIRGDDLPRTPFMLGFALLHASGTVTLFVDPEKLVNLGDHLGPNVHVARVEDFLPTLAKLEGPVQIDPASCPVIVADTLREAGTQMIEAQDPCALPKACKSAAELDGTRAAHLRDGAAMARFLCWLDQQPASSLTEIDVVTKLEGERSATNALRDISFDTICGAGPNGAIVHYRVTEKTNRAVEQGLLLVDSGGQYVDGTTDITRTIAIGTVSEEERRAFTLVLKGMIAISKLRWPKGLAGRDMDSLARVALWEHGMDYGHGTGHGVGSYLSVHEGPQRLARTGTVPFMPGMILSNEPGFYKEGAFGIRIENLIVVEEAPALPGQTVPDMYRFETLTYVPIDTRLIDTGLLTDAERRWLNAYHTEVLTRIGTLVEGDVSLWLTQACAPI
ncbi:MULTISPECIES: aminopeptidase P family protein [Marivita]|uniref:Aminopeptidase P family protein n=1 Tax=Marivita cryptomonadis TaxID=505252 RepID=A0A9Q2P2L0_9RHOB|nr:MULTISPECIES: aminopeptidase P family protein [Marivita]MCR9167964.1 aminopeptidase P family protein [Paracoccaceae bacterium]MBM2321344.1 aminopeptidase P family protein [Marivita cryptomonadis]MBM2330925.1 aminopeptidase P family protein [Marivita cryptomonadis]MBM2340511.1 aminopeptidase P family protein [Marivita cryptomonadis]MBM2345173.1 aminopeptidase P family protein [Marivita cryptomonadis]